MFGRLICMILVSVFWLALAGTPSFSQNGRSDGERTLPDSFTKVFSPDPGGLRFVKPGGEVTIKPTTSTSTRMARSCKGDIVGLCNETRDRPSACLMEKKNSLSRECRSTLHAIEADDLTYTGGVAPCSHAPVCGNGVINESQVPRVEWRQNMGYRPVYPIALPQDGLTDIADGGAVSLGIDSKGDIWVLQRNATGTPQLSEFDSHYKLIRRVGDDIIGHQIKAHGIAIDPQDNVWVCDAARATVQVVSPEGKLIKTFEIRGKRGDWDEAKGQRLLWQPLSVATDNCGCVAMPEGDKAYANLGDAATSRRLDPNAVAAFSDGAILASIPRRPGTTPVERFNGSPTGDILEWKPGDDSFHVMQGVQVAYANGLEISPDESEFYVAAYSAEKIYVFSRQDPLMPVREVTTPGIMPDNIR